VNRRCGFEAPSWRTRILAAVTSAAVCGLLLLVLDVRHLWLPVSEAPSTAVVVVADLVEPAPPSDAVVAQPARIPKSTAPRGSVDDRAGSKNGSVEVASPDNKQDSLPLEDGIQTRPHTAPDSNRSPLRIDVPATLESARPLVRQMAEAAGVPLDFGIKTKEQLLAEAISSAEKRDCLGPRGDLSGDLVQLAIYVHTIAVGKCKGQ
jgi:hypothetical protein